MFLRRHPPEHIRRWNPIILVILVASAALAQTLPPASGTAALEHISVLSQGIGPRVAGTPSDERAAEYVASQLRRLGYTVERQPFQFRVFEEVQPPLLTILSPAATTLSPVTLEYSASTPDGGVEAELGAAGLGRDEDLRGRRLDGKVVLVERGQIRFAEKAANAAASGAVAVIVYNNQPGPAQAGTLVDPSRIPAVMISQEEGQRLVQVLNAGTVRVRLVVATVVGQRTSQNIIGIKMGTRSPREIVVVGGHADAVRPSPGANDNASGVAAMLEAARLLAATPTARTIHFVAFGAEELGLFGSRFYVEHPPGTVVGMVNMDMVGRGNGLMIGNSGNETSLLEVAERVARRLGIRVSRFRLRDAGSDYYSFEQAGIPVVFLHTGDDEAIHTPNDVIGRINPELLGQAAALAAGVALEVASPGR